MTLDTLESRSRQFGNIVFNICFPLLTMAGVTVVIIGAIVFLVSGISQLK